MGAQDLKALHRHIEAHRDARFRWGVHDCFTFTNGAWQAMYGRGWADDWRGRYIRDGQPMLPSQLRAEFGAGSFREAVAQRLAEVHGVPPRGALVSSPKPFRWAAGVALGICIGQTAVFVGISGLVFEPVERIDGAWV